jgi:hypothetical protein
MLLHKELFLACIVLFILSVSSLAASVNAASMWSQTYGEADISESAYSVIATPDGGYAIAGNAYAAPYWNSTDAWVVKTDSFGNEMWNRTYGGTGSDIAF